MTEIWIGYHSVERGTDGQSSKVSVLTLAQGPSWVTLLRPTKNSKYDHTSRFLADLYQLFRTTDVAALKSWVKVCSILIPLLFAWYNWFIRSMPVHIFAVLWEEESCSFANCIGLDNSPYTKCCDLSESILLLEIVRQFIIESDWSERCSWMTCYKAWLFVNGAATI